jgi:CMP-N-acetylneuraminic acid synthetase
MSSSIPIIIPVRNNPDSPRCPGKMTREFANKKSLLEIYLSKFEGRDDVYVMARDPDLQDVARKYGLKVGPRSEKSITSEDVREIWSFLWDLTPGIPYDTHVCFLNACCPLIQASSVDNAIEVFEQSDADALFSVKEVPELAFTPDGEQVDTGLCFNSKYRQPLLLGTNSIIIFEPLTLHDTGGFWSKADKLYLYQLSEIESYDIDTELDFVEAQAAWDYAIDHGLF